MASTKGTQNDYVLYRKSTKDFVRFTDGEIFITADEDERNDEFTTEFNDGSRPVCFTLSYCHFYNSLDERVDGVRIFEFSRPIWFFAYGNDEEFRIELELFGKKYGEKLKRREKKSLAVSI